MERFNEANKINDTNISTKIPLKYYNLGIKRAALEDVSLSKLWRKIIVEELTKQKLKGAS